MHRFRYISLVLLVLVCSCSKGAKATPEAIPDRSVELQPEYVEEGAVVQYARGDESSAEVRRNQGAFAVPAGLRPRVDFWKDIFAKYDSKQVVVHHREFPQIVFGIIDLRSDAESMGPIEFSRHKDAVEERTVAAVKAELEPLARGEGASTEFQRKIVRIMQPVPGGAAKYRRMLDEDLVRTQTGIRDRYVEAVRRSRRYLPMMEHIFVNEYGLPQELTRLPFVESSFDYTAYSSVGAAGIWQFMPRTARAHSMKVGKFVDERRDPLKATHAAAEYLRSAYRSLGSWPLAITSYNHGVGGVRSKIRKAGSDDIVTLVEHPTERYFGFASSNFFPEFLAAVEIYDNWRRYFPEVNDEPPLRLISVHLPGPASPHYVASQLNIPLDDLREANYALLDPIWRGTAKIPAGYTLRVPASYQDRVDRLMKGQSSSGDGQVIPVLYTPPSRASSGKSHIVKRGESLATIAKRYNTTPQRLLELNDLSSQQLKAGQTLIVNEPSNPPVRELSASMASYKNEKLELSGKRPSQTVVKRTYVVKRGDTLSAVSKKTGRSIEELKRANKIKGSGVAVGQRLVVP
jgi:membrane-bound lytic murein transglycosylase D